MTTENTTLPYAGTGDATDLESSAYRAAAALVGIDLSVACDVELGIRVCARWGEQVAALVPAISQGVTSALACAHVERQTQQTDQNQPALHSGFHFLAQRHGPCSWGRLPARDHTSVVRRFLLSDVCQNAENSAMQ